MKAGDKVVCVDDEGWLLPDEGPKNPPKKGQVYAVKSTEYFGAVLAISLVGFWDEGFYRASRFRPVSEVGHPPIEVEQPAPQLAETEAK